MAQPPEEREAIGGFCFVSKKEEEELMLAGCEKTIAWLLGLLMAAALALASSVAWAAATQTASGDADKPVAKMEEMVVISTQPGVEITPDKTVINMNEFQRPSGVRTLTDVLSEIGGVDVQRINPLMASPGDEVSIRGLNEGRMVIEIDGRRINHTGHSGRYIVDWSTLNMDDVERIEIIRGGHSVLHPFAIGGVINIITKKGKKTAKVKPDIKVDGGYGSFNTKYGAVSINGGAADFIGYNLSYADGETDGYLRNNFQKNKSFNGHLSFYLPKDMQLSFSVKHSNVEYGYPVLNDPSRSDWDPNFPTFRGDADQLRHVPPIGQLPGYPIPYWSRDTTYLDLMFTAPIWGGEFKLHGFSTEGKRWNHFYSGGNFVSNFSDDLTRGVIAQMSDLKLGKHNSFTFGAEYQELGTPNQENQTIGWPRIENATYRVTSFYIQDVMRYGALTITPGVRYYHVDMDTYYAWFENGEEDPAWPTGGKHNEEDGFYPSLKADYQFTNTTNLYAAISRSYRLPCP
jgi:outer membrane cobalamin receptor